MVVGVIQFKVQSLKLKASSSHALRGNSYRTPITSTYAFPRRAWEREKAQS